MGLSAIFFFFYVFVVGCIGYLSSKKATEEDFMIAGYCSLGLLAASFSSRCMHPFFARRGFKPAPRREEMHVIRGLKPTANINS